IGKSQESGLQCPWLAKAEMGGCGNEPPLVPLNVTPGYQQQELIFPGRAYACRGPMPSCPSTLPEKIE
ncbi:hypothetical protein P7K49_001593, partial [Saguinus oedipus]